MEFAPPPSIVQNFTTAPPPLPPQQSGPPSVSGQQPHHHHGGRYHHHFGGGAGKPGHPYFKNFNKFGPGGLMTQDDFDGKRLRKSVMRKTVDYNAAIVKALNARIWQRDHRDRHALQPESIYIPDVLPPSSYLDNPSNAVTTKFVKTATNKMRCPIFTLAWTPEGRRLVTGASSGEFTLWNGLTFNFETILQAHDAPVRTMIWSHNDSWMVTGDHSGFVKYWQSNMNNVKMFQAHKEAIRGISFSPNDSKFASCSDDGTLRIWDFFRCQEEKVLRGHGADVKCVHWHPQKSLLVSGSKDNQQPIKLWDPKSGQALATLHAHKSTVMDLKWNDNGNWLVTASRDHLLKLFDLRNLREEVQIFRGHKKEASSVSWHPAHEGLFCSGGSDGSILFWNVGTDKEIGAIDTAHDSIVWTLAWHPLGHILCSGSNDHTIKFWTRNRPGDLMRDKYNLNTLPPSLAGLDECDLDDNTIIPGMGPEDKVEFTESLTADKGFIPGLELDVNNIMNNQQDKKVPYSKPIPRNFQAQWNDTGRPDEDEIGAKEFKDIVSQLNEKVPGPNCIPTAILVYGKIIPILPNSNILTAVMAGPDALNRYISSGEIEEINDLLPKECKPDKVKSPPVKKSRFNDPAPIHDHKAKFIFGNDTDLRQNILQQQQQQQKQPPQSQQQNFQQQMSQNQMGFNQNQMLMNQNQMGGNQNQMGMSQNSMGGNQNQMSGFNNQFGTSQTGIPSLLNLPVIPQPDFDHNSSHDEDFRRYNNKRYDDDDGINDADDDPPPWSQKSNRNFIPNNNRNNLNDNSGSSSNALNNSNNIIGGQNDMICGSNNMMGNPNNKNIGPSNFNKNDNNDRNRNRNRRGNGNNNRGRNRRRF